MDLIGEMIGELAINHVLPYVLTEVVRRADDAPIGPVPLRASRPTTPPMPLRAVDPDRRVPPWPTPCYSVLSQTPGRLRLRVEGLRDDGARAALLTTALRALPGVQEVTPNTLTGSALVYYEASRVSAETVLTAIENALDSRAALPRWRVANWSREREVARRRPRLVIGA